MPLKERSGTCALLAGGADRHHRQTVRHDAGLPVGGQLTEVQTMLMTDTRMRRSLGRWCSLGAAVLAATALLSSATPAWATGATFVYDPDHIYVP